MRPIRFMQAPHTLFEVTIRTIHARLLLCPSPALNELVLGVLGRALDLCPSIRLYAFKLLSNHAHLILSAPDHRSLSRFMNHVDSNIAREAGRLHKWRDKFWSRRYRAIPILDDDSLCNRLRYLFAHGCKENLVESPLAWPGASSDRALTDGAPIKGKWIDRSALFRARQRGDRQAQEPGSFIIEYDVPLQSLPCFDSMDDERAFCRKLVDEIVAETRERHENAGTSPLGAKAVLDQDPHALPCKSNKSPAPLCHAHGRERRIDFAVAYSAFVTAYRLASDLFRSGKLDAHFPDSCFPPPLPYRMAVATGPP